MKTIRNIILYLAVVLVCSSATSHHPITVYMIGDSTMANKSAEKHPEMGWGQAFESYFGKDVKVDNRAMDGRSTRSFIAEGRWESILQTLKENDYVIIQFGHNDEKVDTPRGTTLYDYKENLKRFIRETRAKKAIPILLTPVTRRTFTDGKLVNSHGDYPKAAREVAVEENVAFIDALKLSEEIVVELGPEASKQLYLWVEPGEYTYYPEGKKDNTHFTSHGAHIIAGAVAKEIKKMDLPLSKLFK
ncbi:rhamnogalacturonan acetylesterase [Bacteroides sp. 51]|uniref:rhamnogalacturonan acetylesterase n=1 Tax=Bacteroides sp. 51 TaxID=2302938 RepID=UPI0013CFEABB|nr:rhamnogalacturonan acetylesterase [Bacteroides sp. 51]NDV83238.1 hypothetical protein [Bacteroides sp. 51]